MRKRAKRRLLVRHAGNMGLARGMGMLSFANKLFRNDQIARAEISLMHGLGRTRNGECLCGLNHDASVAEIIEKSRIPVALRFRIFWNGHLLRSAAD